MELLGTRFYSDLYICNSVDSKQCLSCDLHPNTIQEDWKCFHGTGMYPAGFDCECPSSRIAVTLLPLIAGDFAQWPSRCVTGTLPNSAVSL